MSVAPDTIYWWAMKYLYNQGWIREEEGSGWFWHPDREGFECTLGEAIQRELELGGIDTRKEPNGLKSPSYWGDL